MKYAVILALLLSVPQTGEMTGRQYYKELYAAGGLDHLAAEYVCFQDSPENGTFFIFAKSDDIRNPLMADKSFFKLSKELQTMLNRDVLLVRGYEKGLPFKDYDFYSPDGATWTSEEHRLDKDTAYRLRLTIVWETLRYKRTGQISGKQGTETPYYGKCERVASGVKQHAN